MTNGAPSSSMLGRRFDIAQSLHASANRDYAVRWEDDRALCAEIASRFDYDYWDGDRRYGYGGYRYDGRWRPIAEQLVEIYGLRAGDRVLDVGCGKGYLLYELAQVVPGLLISGLDISDYALAHAKEEVAPHLRAGGADQLPYPDRSFDLVLSFKTLPNLSIEQLWSALREITRVGERAYLAVESYRDEREKANLLTWNLIARSFYSVEDWEFLFRLVGYRGDYGFVFYT